MKIQQRVWTETTGWSPSPPVPPQTANENHPALVLVCGSRAALEQTDIVHQLLDTYPAATQVFCSTAGEIAGMHVLTDSLVVTEVQTEKSRVQAVETTASQAGESFDAGTRLADQLDTDGLVHVLVFSDGLKVNGTDLVRGLQARLPASVTVTGGLVGDGTAFQRTLVGLNQVPDEGRLVAVGWYGEALRVGYGSMGGWDAFGPPRRITRSEGNVLYELDGKPALSLYKQYLGDRASGLPSTGLLFPLCLELDTEAGRREVVRTLLAVDEEAQSMTFAGTIPTGVSARLMKANFERLVDGAAEAASMSVEHLRGAEAELAVLVSCVGRKIILKERTEEEVEAVQAVLGKQATLCGFYSYGEICPSTADDRACQLHNQTMTITSFREL